ncbi:MULTISPECIES: VOC family protein [unclassified Streptomyces]|uniref:VOC family protein n=1 Tax=unclassified Streptomyces TaxID=2593676 RepID=UPI000DAE2BEB|nr:MULTISPECIES: VOC family protein [unclassified Streptomyces]PZT75226.1 VOC family protein [Streptomyces sp. AC1-42T]PZT83589.1 VOC family protein [Streptomyces sp. AC1-42W]
MNTPYKPGTPCWIDLMVPDQQAAIDFYRDLFGWQGEVGPPEQGGYSLCTLEGKPVAGIMKAMNPDGTVPDPMPPTAWTTYLSTDDIDATVAAVTNSGGTVVVGPMDVMDLGRMAVVTDPAGAVFGLWQPGTFDGAAVVNEPGALIWSELVTPDPAAASAFYSSILPVTTARSEMEGAEGYIEFQVAGRPVGGIMDLNSMPEGVPPHWQVYFNVDSVDDVQAAAVHAGATVLAPAFDMVAGRMAVLADPQGGAFAVIATPEGSA